MSFIKKFNFVGGRVLKTGMAVFITALICELLGWPPMFAVITAIVTIEPTAADSIKKAYVRFPASAIGAAFSVVFNFAFDDSPLTYMLVAVATIIACHRLRLHDGALVAVLTGVAMISTVHDHYLSSFFIRLGTTLTGLTVSTLVNLLVIRPDYSRSIKGRIQQLILETGNLIATRGIEITKHQPLHRETRAGFQKILKDIEGIETLCKNQKKEWKLHQFDRKDMRNIHYEFKKLTILRQIHYHVGNLFSLPSMRLPEVKANVIQAMVKSIKAALHHPDFLLDEEHDAVVKELLSLLRHEVEEREADAHRFSEETIIFYELVSIHDLLEELNHIHKFEIRHQLLLEKSLDMG
ncbi:aromatic acid exporter family protein [Mesobacillus jeotgali]|uniref:aromatic acid exporter family protein n=1 Tax=Mesobacillus jeotgali TaxID=129985 RepID=UPI0009A6705A|nr:aromatic acid exporter family protein [Mesobacillus jeotgali]